jgi:hypothetical protein
LGYLLLNRTTDLAALKTLKDHAKELVSRADSEAKKAAATAICYAAIASALVFHGSTITRHSYSKLRKPYQDLEQKPWIPSDLKDLFKKAQAACQEKKS